MNDGQLRPGEPVLYAGPYAAYARTGHLLGSCYLPAGSYCPLLAGAAYFAPLGVSWASCF